MNILKERRDTIKQIIQNNNFIELQKYISNEDINLKNINDENFDLLVFAIENNTNPEIIRYIIYRGNYKTLNYYVTEDNSVKIPLFLLISKNEFKLADFLLKNQASINYTKENILS